MKERAKRVPEEKNARLKQQQRDERRKKNRRVFNHITFLAVSSLAPHGALAFVAPLRLRLAL